MNYQTTRTLSLVSIFFVSAALAVFSLAQPVIAGTEVPISLDAASQRYPAIDGNRIVWSDNRNGNWDIYMYDLVTKAETQITDDSVNQTHPDISGDRIVWLNWTMNGYIDLHMYDLKTRHQFRIPFSGISTVIPLDFAGDVFFPKISGNRIVWENPTNTYGVGIYAYDINLDTITKISHDAGWARQVNPSISGDKVVWEDFRSGNPDIYMYDFVSGLETRITNDENNQRYPDIGGNRIVWMGNGLLNRAYDIYVYDLLTQTENRVSITGPGNTNHPKISGDKVIWWDLRSSQVRLGISSIYMYDLTTQTEMQITPDNANLQTPGSSSISDGKIVWTDWRTGYPDIYMYDLNPNVAPIAQISPIPTVTLGQSAVFDGSASTDSDGTITNYHWDFGDSTSGDGATANHTYAAAGAYQVTLTVTDDDGATATATVSVLVNAPPIAVVAPVSLVNLGTAITFDGSASSDSDGMITNYSWDFGDGSIGSGQTTPYTYTAAGTYPVVLTVTDNNGATAIATITARVNAPPMAHIAPVSAIILGEVVTFDGSGSSDSDGAIAAYAWDFGDGATGTGSSATNTYATAGVYQVTLTVTDNDGATGTATTTVIVQTATQAIDGLIDVVQDMNLSQGITNSLDSKLQNVADALSAANAGNREDAINKLQAFISAVEAQSGNKITVEQANQLIDAANRIIAAIQS